MQITSFKKTILGAFVIGLIIFVISRTSFGEDILGSLLPSSSPAPSQVAAVSVAQKFDSADQIKAKYKLENVALKKEAPDKNGVETMVGDPNAAEFTPELKLSRWEGEVSLKIKPDVSGVATKDKNLNFEGEKIKFSTPHAQYNFYDQPAGADGGGYEFDVVFNQKPTSNIVQIPIETQNLDFFYQPPLNQEKQRPNVVSCSETQCFDKDGQVVVERPENVVGSYAVYYANNIRGDYTALGGKNYMSGKAFHIYRPKVIDASNSWVWGDLHVDVVSGIMTVTIPQSFLDSAVYPVTVDPYFGNYSPCSSEAFYSYANIFEGGQAAPTSDGIVSSISFYSYNSGTSMKGLLVLSADHTIVGGAVGAAIAMPATLGWATSTFATGPSVTNGTNYLVGGVFNSDLHIAYDGSGGTEYSATCSYANPTTLTGGSGTSYRICAYAVYAPAAGGATAATSTVIFNKSVIFGKNIKFQSND